MPIGQFRNPRNVFFFKYTLSSPLFSLIKKDIRGYFSSVLGGNVELAIDWLVFARLRGRLVFL